MELNALSNFSFRRLAHFVAVVEAGTISGAAERLFMSPSAISGSITELERALGTDLLVRRRGHGISLTPTGTHVLARARALIEEATELNLLARGSDEGLVGPLAVGCFVTLAPTVLPALLAEFEARHPKVTLDFLEGSQTELQERLVAGELDLAVLYDLELTVPLQRTVLSRPRAYALFGEGHPLAREATVTLEQLAQERLILFDASPSVSHVMSLFGHHGLTPRLGHRTHSYDLTRALVARDTSYYAILVQRSRATTSHEGLPLVEREIRPEVPSSSVVLAWPTDATLSPRAQAFADIARQQAQAAGAPVS